MNGLRIAVLLGVLLIMGGFTAARLRLPAPLVLLVLGLALGFVPPLGGIELPPDAVLLLFLPALLYWESLNTSSREIRRNIRAILLNAIPLVLATVALVAWLGTAAGLTVTVGITLGAIVGPTDATAVTTVAGSLPRRTLTMLRAESLINDGTALTVYSVAVAAVVGHSDIQIGIGILQFLAAYAGGVLVGLAIAMLARLVRRLLRGNSLLENTVSVVTPFAAYLPAEQLHVSGVIAVVTVGLMLSRFGPRIVSAETRAQAQGFWQVTTWILNGSLFLLIGFQAHATLARLENDPVGVLPLALATTVAVIGIRLAWIGTTPYLLRAIDRRPSQRTLRVPLRQRSVNAWAGFRGAVSLAAALALPSSFPMRAQLIAVTLVVILVTLLLQGLTLPRLVRWAHLPEDPTEADEELRAQRAAITAGLAEIPDAARQLGVPDPVRDRVLREYRDQVEASQPDTSTGDPTGRSNGTEVELRRAIISAKREAVVRLRDSNEIDDTVLRRVQQRLDLEELRLGEAASSE